MTTFTVHCEYPSIYRARSRPRAPATIILLRLGMAVKSNVVEAFDGRKPGGADPSFDGAALMDPDTLFAD